MKTKTKKQRKPTAKGRVHYYQGGTKTKEFVTHGQVISGPDPDLLFEKRLNNKVHELNIQQNTVEYGQP